MFFKKKSFIYSNNSFFVSKKLTKKEEEMERNVNDLANEIKQKLSEGKKPEFISIKEKYNMYNIINHILSKNNVYMNYAIILKQFLYTYDFLEIFSLPECFIDKNDLFNKISLIMRKEEVSSDKIIYLNGQMGKKFYIILEGVVTILEPTQFCVRATYQKFYQYLQFLLDNNEYELIRLSFNSNQKYVNEKKTLYKDKFYKFNELLDRYITSDIKFESIDYKSYLEKFEFFIKQIFGENNFLNEEQKKIYEEIENKIEEEEKIKKEKEKEEEEKEMEEDAVRKITGIDAENDRNEIIDKIKKNRRESILAFKRKKAKKNLDREKVFNLWKYDYKTINLNQGNYFGEISLNKNDNKIKNTIISKTNCLFCILERDEYRNLINEFMDNARRINVDSLMHSLLFHNYNADLFNIHYYSFFTPIKKYKGDYLFRQKETRKKIFFIKSGGVQIEYLSSWGELDYILDILTDNDMKIKKSLNDLIIPNEMLHDFIQKKQKFNIFIYFNGEIVGTNEILYPGTNIFMFDAICTSECEIFSLDLSSLAEIINEKLIMKNYNELNVVKKNKLIQRLIALKYNIIFQYNRKIHDKMKGNSKNGEKKDKSDYYSLEEKPRDKALVKNNNFFKSTANIKKEIEIIINNSPEQNKKGKLFQLRKFEPLTLRNIDSNKDNKIIDKYISSKNLFNSDNNSKINFDNRKLKLINIRNNSTEYLATERSDKNKSPRRKNMINVNIKGKVPKLLLTQVNTMNKVIDHLILKEKDLFNNNGSQNSIKNKKKFISHLDILGFDNFINKIESDFKINKEENTKTKRKKISKFVLSPVPLKKRKMHKF